jgi:hypothetical protein
LSKIETYVKLNYSNRYKEPCKIQYYEISFPFLS